MTEPTYKRFCRTCGRQTYNWYCCGKRTSRVNLQATMADVATIRRKTKDHV